MKTVALVLALSIVALGNGPAGPAAMSHARANEAVASPRILMFHDGPMSAPAFVTEFPDIHDVLHDKVGPLATAADLENRPVITITFFWHNPTWEPFVQDPEKLKTLKPSDAQATCVNFGNCTAHYYPAFAGKRALLDDGTRGEYGRLRGTWPVGEKGLATLRRIGIPTEM